MSSIRNLAGVAIASVFALASGTASAATVTQCGPNICYEYDDAQGTLYGNPILSGDALVFTPTTFRAESTGTQGVDTETANFVFTNIYSVGGAEIADIQVSEFLDYDIINGDSVTADLRLTATRLGGIPEIQSTLATFTATGDSGGQQSTTLTGSISPADLFEGTANSMTFSLQNTLTAETDAVGENAWIQKKATITITALVPIPAAVWLFGSGLVGLVAWGRRR